MRYGKLVVEKREYEKVKKILAGAEYLNDAEQKTAIRKLQNELRVAELKPELDMPDDVVRLNSTVIFRMPEMSLKRFKIVSPEESDISQKRLSLLSPMGLALFGYAKGDEIEWQFPSGTRTISIIEVEQPKNDLS
ncbi:GreA/GreB family elongation factor [Flavobacterium sedimenticola]|uniref:GreA/GreB family elongation factor n=1 Tax=Flavobacterium sedimenticola TaxID=3043286 RepID=A0ABT6XP25_9FLAO|nr:GreA/GreB family elongation factor [Flavobacterium sedimenticola]MDI9256740.1 GreA/GreB family elongation factor [Flavobacterium sedimenticola]